VARRSVIEQGKVDGREHLVAIDKEGRFVFRTDGSDNEVRLDPVTNDKLEDPNEAIDIVHNHPPQPEVPGMLGSSLSPPDVMTLNGPGERSVTAVTHDGSYFTASRVDMDKLRALFTPQTVLDEMIGISPIGRQWQNMNSVLTPYEDSGKLSRADAEILGFHSMWLGVAKAGYLNYDYHLSEEASKIVTAHQEVVDKVIDKVHASITEIKPHSSRVTF
jgi:hypothetical protein